MGIGTEIKDQLQKLAPSLSQERPLENFSEEILTEEEEKEALRLARERKHYARVKAEYFEKISQPLETVKYTAEQVFEYLKQNIVIDSDNELIIKKLCAYFTNDPRFEKNDLKLGKGILLFGGVGVGKTTLLRMFVENMAFSYRIISCRDIERKFSEEGDVIIDRISQNMEVANNVNRFGHKVLGYCFDDLGTETSVSKHYGKQKNVMAEILLNRYDLGLDFRSTHITTNLSVYELTEVYGTRVLDRIKQAYNIICFDPESKSRR